MIGWGWGVGFKRENIVQWNKVRRWFISRFWYDNACCFLDSGCINDPWHAHSCRVYLLSSCSINLGMSVSHQSRDMCRRALVSSANSTAAARCTPRRLDRTAAECALASRSGRAMLCWSSARASCGRTIWQPGWSSLMPALFPRSCPPAIPWTGRCAVDMTAAGLLCCLVLVMLASIHMPPQCATCFAYLSLPLAVHQADSMVDSYFLFIWIAYIYLFAS